MGRLPVPREHGRRDALACWLLHLLLRCLLRRRLLLSSLLRLRVLLLPLRLLLLLLLCLLLLRAAALCSQRVACRLLHRCHQ